LQGDFGRVFEGQNTPRRRAFNRSTSQDVRGTFIHSTRSLRTQQANGDPTAPDPQTFVSPDSTQSLQVEKPAISL
jgi:hypothetical protein